jgi:ATP-binding cassette subfamily B protein
MLSPPPILILDEATSSIDLVTEQRITQSFMELMKNRTSFVVAHRLSTIISSDIILVMNNGQVVESGSHNQLISKNGFYKQLYQSQFN